MEANAKTSSSLDPSSSRAPLKILTVGDGDLTLSLSLSRAYGDQIDLTATTLCGSQDELCSTYSNSATVLDELQQQRHATIVYGVDATQLSRQDALAHHDKFDLVLFHHPHLGLMTSLHSTDEQRHALRHFVLLAHYLNSAQSILSTSGGLVHLCLAHDQPHTWRMHEAAERQGLELVKSADTIAPFHALVNQLLPHKTPLDLQPHDASYNAPRKYRNGRLGSKHYLGKYGYQHRRTHGDKFDGKAGDMNVNGSHHYFFAPAPQCREEQHKSSGGEVTTTAGGSSSSKTDIECSICGLTFDSQVELQQHLEAPALPDPPQAVADSKPEKPETSDNPPENENKSKSQPVVVHKKTDSSNNPTPTTQQQQWQVLSQHDGKRLRRFLQHVAFPNQRRSKKQCDQLVAQGHILVNGTIAYDVSRILRHGDTVASLTTHQEASQTLQTIDLSTLAKIPIVASYPKEDNDSSSSGLVPQNYRLVVAHKPVGMRTRGEYESSFKTLEQVVSYQLGNRYKSLSSMETGCNGLCVLQQQQTNGKGNVTVTHDFTVLVYGHVPEEWNDGVTVQVPWKCIRRFGRQRETYKRDEGEVEGTNNITIGNDAHSSSSLTEDATTSPGATEGAKTEAATGDSNQDKSWNMTITCTERTSLKRRANDETAAPPLCTLTISTDCPVSGTQQAIILYLRKQRFPVVGDRLCPKEYQTLPRSIRNRIKKKLLMGCFQVHVSCTMESSKEKGQQDSSCSWTSSVQIPERFSATFWQQHWENAMSSPVGNAA